MRMKISAVRSKANGEAAGPITGLHKRHGEWLDGEKMV